ncbi:zinc finger protein 239-like [Orussus abietinus]|uniref:zinc finger protein 239-like n=1 Tax=Orussus abietinus TaxID=222816 RepID=UPI00062690FB|nr:zinc finger protein 239-like [Orussus abietinus]
MSSGLCPFRESETFGGLSGMLRQILSPSPETVCSGMTHGSSQMFSYPMLPHSQEMTSPSPEQAPVPIECHMCSTCGLEFRSVPKLNYHVRTSHRQSCEQPENNRKFACTVCSRTFLAQSHLRMHEVTHSSESERSFGCDKCQASFRYRTLLERHRKMHDLDQEKPYSCPRCFMRFETRNLYNHHTKTHRPVQVHALPNPVTTSRITASGVAATSAPEKPPTSYPCDSCTKQFATPESLTSHKAVHRSRPLVCDVCGKGFTHRKYYVVHQRIHTGERPYLCAMCGKSFTQASTLTVHRRYHTGERPYTCTLCGKGFVTRTIMLNHSKKH